jgi:hypothetical protein
MCLRMRTPALLAAALGLSIAGCGDPRPDPRAALVGAWRSQVQFESGAFAGIRDLEFLYVFHADGTLTESSNYDGAPPVPPAYGVWRTAGEGEYEAKYEFFATRPPESLEALATGGGWLPAGRGVLVERIRVAPDGGSFTSSIRYEALGVDGRPAEGGGEAEGRATRIVI